MREPDNFNKMQQSAGALSDKYLAKSVSYGSTHLFLRKYLRIDKYQQLS